MLLAQVAEMYGNQYVKHSSQSERKKGKEVAIFTPSCIRWRANNGINAQKADFSVSFLRAQAHKYIYTYVARKYVQKKTAGVHRERFMI